MDRISKLEALIGAQVYFVSEGSYYTDAYLGVTHLKGVIYSTKSNSYYVTLENFMRHVDINLDTMELFSDLEENKSFKFFLNKTKAVKYFEEIKCK